LVRRQSVVNIENFRKQYARRRWQLSFRIVALCNHLTRIMKKGRPKPQITYSGMLVSFKSCFRNASQCRLQDKPKMGYEGQTVAVLGRECESDQEEEVIMRRPQTRKRSNTS
ncbi:hypothetical protein cypCar_00018181, partial [Cyprinus carpio]